LRCSRRSSPQASPVNVFLSDAAPALPADGKLLSLEQDVQLDVLAAALVLPRILTMLQTHEPPMTLTNVAKTAFKTHAETALRLFGEVSESKLYTLIPK